MGNRGEDRHKWNFPLFFILPAELKNQMQHLLEKKVALFVQNPI